jgi:hypothetical protein
MGQAVVALVGVALLMQALSDMEAGPSQMRS